MRSRVLVMIAAATIACSAVAFFVERAVGQEEHLGPTMTQILQARVSLNVQNAKPVEVWDAAFKACAEAAVKAGAEGFTAAPDLAPEYPAAAHQEWRITLSVKDMRVGDLLRLLGAILGCDVYVKGQREIALAAPATREQRGVLAIAPLSANDY